MSEMVYDVVVVGGGVAGLSAAWAASQAGVPRVAVVAKVLPIRSHTGAAQGGIAAALGNEVEDDPDWHWYDTVLGGDGLSDEDAVRLLVDAAPETVFRLEHLGVPFSRRDDGRLAQRRFGGHTIRFGAEPASRACFAADRTGQLVLHTLWQQCLSRPIEWFDEHLVIDLIADQQGGFKGLATLVLHDGSLRPILARCLILAAGGGCRHFPVTSTGRTNTLDLLALAIRHGLPVADPEFVQFHPTGLATNGFLISEAARGEGGWLINRDGRRFMADYAPTRLELAPRDLVSQAIQAELAAGRGCPSPWGPCVHLDLRHLGRQVLTARLPDICDLARHFAGIDPAVTPIPVKPTAHYLMGGLPVDLSGQVRRGPEGLVEGLFAAGECSCTSVHGANRLGTNSLLEGAVFGHRAGRAAAGQARHRQTPVLGPDDLVLTVERLQALRLAAGPLRAGPLLAELKQVMGRTLGIERTAEGLRSGLAALDDLANRLNDLGFEARSGVCNPALLAAFELGSLIQVARVQAAAAAARPESRGAHRFLGPDGRPLPRDDTRFHHHSLARAEAGRICLDRLPVRSDPVTRSRLPATALASIDHGLRG